MYQDQDRPDQDDQEGGVEVDRHLFGGGQPTVHGLEEHEDRWHEQGDDKNVGD